MISSTRLALAVAAIGLAGPVAANERAPAVLANPDLDALTASAVAPGAGAGAGVSGGPVLFVEGRESAQDVRSGRGSGRWTLSRSAAGAAGGGDQLPTAPSAAASGAGDTASATGRSFGGSIGRSITAQSSGSAATASAAASSPGLASIGVSSRAGPGFAASASRSASSFSR